MFVQSFTDTERSALLAAACAVVYTPTNEHFGIVPLEAMAAGRPVLACNSGGPRESVLHGTTGLLAEPQPVAFARAMAQLAVSRNSTALMHSSLLACTANTTGVLLARSEDLPLCVSHKTLVLFSCLLLSNFALPHVRHHLQCHAEWHMRCRTQSGRRR